MNDRPIRVLLVDDEPDFVDMLALRLEGANMHVQCAGGGAECLQLLGKDHFDVLVLDLLMPEMNGVATLEEIRRRNNDIEVIIMTGHGPAQDLARCEELGAYATLLKPADFDQVLLAIRGAFNAYKA
ncbi:MAG: response regulator [Proteobacteria bacterium]|nr:response regulator [Pseudomonadota bacterium]